MSNKRSQEQASKGEGGAHVFLLNTRGAGPDDNAKPVTQGR